MKHWIKKNRIILAGAVFLVVVLVLCIQAGYLFARSRDISFKEETTEKGTDSGATTEADTRVTEADGTLFTGFIRENGTLRYYSEGEAPEAEGWVTQEEDKYYVNKDGSVKISQLFRDGDAVYYVDTAGRMVHGFFTVDGRLRYFGEDGRMKEEAGWLELEGKYYYIDATAAVVTAKDCPLEAPGEDAPYIYGMDTEKTGGSIGRYTVKGKDYLFDEHGMLLTGQVAADEYSFFYTDKDGAILMDQDITIGEKTYHAEADGRVYVGTMFEKTREYGSATDYLILCNLDTQRTAVYEGEKGNWRLLREMLVSTGAPINPTPKGTYETTVHTEHFNAYGVRAWYATGFIGGLYLFHSLPYESDSEPRVLTEDRLGEPLSHGCVRMRLEDAKWMYDRLPLRTRVVIYEDEDELR